jgi:hypothetical protein
VEQKKNDDQRSDVLEIIDFLEHIRGIRDNIDNEIADMPTKVTISHYIAVLEELNMGD